MRMGALPQKQLAVIVADEEGIKVVVLEVFPDHKSYDRRFGYRTN